MDSLPLTLEGILDCTLAMIALINPISKIFVLSTLSGSVSDRELRHIALKSSAIAVIILLLFVLAGNVILTNFFHIQIYAFKIAGGIVLFFRGYEALTKGLFFEFKDGQDLEDMSAVPLASPLIAGPATITASVSFPAKYGLLSTCLSILIAVAINLFIMLSSKYINRFLEKHHIMSALIRITGLIVATIGVQMALDGISEFIGR